MKLYDNGERLSYQYQPSGNLTIDLSHIQTTNAYIYGGPGSVLFEIVDNKPRTYTPSNHSNKYILMGLVYWVRVWSDGKVHITTTNTPLLTGKERGMNLIYAPLQQLMLYKGTLDNTKKIIFDFTNHEIIIMPSNYHIKLIQNFNPVEIRFFSPGMIKIYSGYIHVKGGYIIREITSTTHHTHTYTSVPLKPETPHTTTISHTVIIQNPGIEQLQQTSIKYSTYGTIAMVVGIALILIALI